MVPNKHQQRTEATRQRLFRSALHVFAKKGFEPASVDDVARHAGYTRGAFYAHFKTKEDLFFALIEDRTTRYMTELGEKLSQLPTLEERLLSLRDFYAARIRDTQWGLLMLDFKLHAARRGKTGAKLAARLRTVRSQIKAQYLAEWYQPPASPEREHMHVVLDAFLDGLILKRAYEPEAVDEATAERILSEMFERVTLPVHGLTERLPQPR